jgi:hypothetical protein
VFTDQNGVEYDLKAAALAKKLNCCYQHIHLLARQGKIPFMKIGARYWFNEGQVLSALKVHHVPVSHTTEENVICERPKRGFPEGI